MFKVTFIERQPNVNGNNESAFWFCFLISMVIHNFLENMIWCIKRQETQWKVEISRSAMCADMAKSLISTSYESIPLYSGNRSSNVGCWSFVFGDLERLPQSVGDGDGSRATPMTEIQLNWDSWRFFFYLLYFSISTNSSMQHTFLCAKYWVKMYHLLSNNIS